MTKSYDDPGSQSRANYLTTNLMWGLLMSALGFSIGFINYAFHEVTHGIEQFWVKDIVHEQPSRQAMYGLRVVGVLASSIFTGFLTTYIVPECCGGGMLAVKVCLATETSIPLKVGFFRFILTATYIGFGNTLGVEAPTLHICAAISCFLFEAGMIFVGEDIFPIEMRNTVIMIGCTCGTACAFDTPFGGILFMLEEFMHGAGGSNKTFMLLLCVSLFCGVLTTRGLLANKSFFNVEFQDEGGFFLKEEGIWMLYAVPAGVFGAIVSVMFVRMSLYMRSFYGYIFSERFEQQGGRCRRIMRKMFAAQWRPFWGGVITSICGIICWEVTGNEAVFFVGKKDIRGFLTRDYNVLHTLLFLFMKLIAVCACVASDASGGVFYPALVLGASSGAIISQFCKWYSNITNNQDGA